jgi:hypothetical protein
MYPDTLSNHFTWAEAEVTNHRNIDNSIPEELWPTIKTTAYGMERIRTVLAFPIITLSWYRCLELNRAIGSVSTSQHPLGEAVDWICPKYGTPLQVVLKLAKFSDFLRFDQLILEHTWVHVSFKDPNSRPRNEVLTLLRNKKYALGITDVDGNKYYG